MRNMNLVCMNCGAKSYCIEACEPGSIVCLANRLRTGQTKADVLDYEAAATPANPQYCAYCGKPLKVIGTERFCNNVQCLNRFRNV